MLKCLNNSKKLEISSIEDFLIPIMKAIETIFKYEENDYSIYSRSNFIINLHLVDNTNGKKISIFTFLILFHCI